MANADSNCQKKPGIKPKKRLGQNFLAQIGIIQKLVAAAAIQPGETVLEIGPGTGNLTAQLAKTGNKIIAAEKDPEMTAILKEKFNGAKNVEILAGDALKFDETEIAAPYKIAANLPFYLAAPLIRKFLESPNPPLSLAVIVQKEVAQRICSQPPHMNLLAISVQFYATPKIIGYVSKGNFWPVPKVDCAILRIIPKTYEGERTDPKFIASFFKIAKAGFSHPRKQLASNLGRGLGLSREAVDSWLTKNRLAPGQRAETLSVENWIGLAQTFGL
jgi:16S rRNA (adenine1518-N6/adenine1519-N6)-dimethyltransferase